jgi:ABC-type branched-subunit amino acid transport system ATPase component
MGLVSQRRLFTEKTVTENLEMSAASRRAEPYRQRNLERVFEMLLRLKERRDQKAETLRGGLLC